MPLVPFHFTLVQNIKRDPFEQAVGIDQKTALSIGGAIGELLSDRPEGLVVKGLLSLNLRKRLENAGGRRPFVDAIGPWTGEEPRHEIHAAWPHRLQQIGDHILQPDLVRNEVVRPKRAVRL